MYQVKNGEGPAGVKKQIDVNELQIGMYVSELDRPWLETPFLFQGIEIESQAQIDELKRYCKYVFIDVNDSVGAAVVQRRAVEPGPVSGPVVVRPRSTFLNKAPENVFAKTDHKKIEFEILKKTVAPQNKPHAYVDQTSLEEEIDNVRRSHTQAKEMISTIMEDVRLGRSIEVDGAKQVVAEMAASVIRNPDALVCFTQLKNKDYYTAEHSLRVSILSLTFGRQLGCERDALELLGIGALMHDIGKLKIPNDILNKPGELTQQEALLMEQHVPYGVEILEQTSIPNESIDVARYHHERYDGTGYKFGLKGEAIGYFGAIGGIVDFYDAMTSDRSYRAAVPPHVILRDMYKMRNSLFHPHLVEQFIQCMGVYPIGSVVELNTGDVGVVINMNRRRRLKPRVTLVLKPDSRPYTGKKTIDLDTDRTANGGVYEIKTVIEPEKYHINPARYLPIANIA